MDWPEWTRPGPSRAERFWAKVDMSGDCWWWTASVLPNGYGQFDHTTAHRAAMVLSGTEVAGDQVVDHLCRNILCVNPAHLEVVNPMTNVRRGYAGNVLAQGAGERSRLRTHCKRGHEMTPGNTYTPPGQPTWRVCRTCKAGNQRARVARRMAAA